MRFTDVCYITDDVLRLRAFYESVFGVASEGDEVHSSIDLPGLTFTFDTSDLAKDSPYHYVSGQSANNVLVGFNVDDVDAEYERLKLLGVAFLNEPTTHPWGTRSFQFRDPDGNILNFRTAL